VCIELPQKGHRYASFPGSADYGGGLRGKAVV
jgi:hypothetical protein